MLSAPPRFLRGGYGKAFVTRIKSMNYKFKTISIAMSENRIIITKDYDFINSHLLMKTPEKLLM